MIPTRRYLAPAIAALLFALLLLPPSRTWLEGSMTLQMLLQIPLLIGVGYLLPSALPQRFVAGIAQWNHQGINSLVLASLAGTFWMLSSGIVLSSIHTPMESKGCASCV